MTFEDLLFELSVIQFQLSGVLNEDGRRSVFLAQEDLKQQLEEAQRRLEGKKGSKKKKKPLPPWRLEIPPARPLIFVPTTISGHRLIVDLFCLITQPIAPGVPAAGHNVGVRLWTDDMNLWYRAGVDAESMRDAITRGAGKRVMLRFHFDYANPQQSGPRHHLQIGGVQHGSEYCWFPDVLDVPRFCHHPVSLVLACEFVLRTFYPAAYAAVSQEPTWRHAIRRAQQVYLHPYYALQGAQIQDNQLERSYLDRLWN